MFQTIEERKAAVSDLPNQTLASLTEEDSYGGEWICTINLHGDVHFSLQFINRVSGHPVRVNFKSPFKQPPALSFSKLMPHDVASKIMFVFIRAF